jgi:hypothetical protein
MGFAGSQSTDLAQCPLAGSYSWYLELEGGICEPAAGSLNIPWLVGIMAAEGNAGTSALAKNAVVFCEPEWGWDTSGVGKDVGPGQQMVVGGSAGGMVVAW